MADKKTADIFATIPTKRPTKWELKRKLGALIDAADHYNSDLTQIIGRDDNEKVLFLALFALGDEAAAIERLLKRRKA